MQDASPEMMSLFCAVLDLGSDEERVGYLDAACGADSELRARMEALLRAHEQAGGFLRANSEAGDSRAAVAEPIRERPGTVIAPYRLMEQIGQRGMGLVFVAEQQQPVRRKVAIKVIKPGMDTRQVVARFEAERQALALMDHPHIAKVLDGGQTAGGQPYFVMELVKGVPITEHCDQNQVPIPQRLELFLHVCQAVQHAHQKGIIHRDIKPSNVVVVSHDGTPVVKVIDFGVAKAIDQPLTDKTIYTQFSQLIGTPLYMSPEQAGQSGLDVDTRSDIYALGVLLYELLTGTTPFDKERLRTASYDEMRRILREEEPPKPSTRLSTLGQAAAAVSANRKSEPKKLGQLMRGELDWIAMKCLEKDRNRRYETAIGLARDIERDLHDEPVQACPPSAGYRFRKFARRNKSALAIVGLLAAVLVLAIVGLAASNISINRAKDRTEIALETAEANLLLARQAVDEMYMQVADQLGGRPYMQPFQRDILAKALRFYEQFAQRQSGDPALRLEAASARLRVGQVQHILGQHRPAKQACDEAITALEELDARLSTEPKYRLWLATAYSLRGDILGSAGRLQQAAKSYRQALAVYGELTALQQDEPSHRSKLASSYLALGAILSDRPGEAEKEVREGVRLYEQLVGQPHSAIALRESLIDSYITLGNFLAGVERSPEAERAFRQAIDLLYASEESRKQINGRQLRVSAEFALGDVLAANGQREETEKIYRRGIVDLERAVDQFPDVPGYRLSLATYSGKLAALLAQSGKPEEAAALRRSARERFEKLAAEFANDEEMSIIILVTAGHSLQGAGDLEAAEQFQRKVVMLIAKLAEDSAEPFDRRRLATSHVYLGVILQRRGRLREAADQFRRGLAICKQLAAEFPDETEYRRLEANALNFLGRVLRFLPGEGAMALRCHEQALELCRQLVAECPDQPRDRIQLVRSHFGRGLTLQLAGRRGEAVQAFQQALDAYRPYRGAVGSTANQSQFAAVHNELAWLLANWSDGQFRDPHRAVALARKAVELEPKTAAFWNTLGVACYRAGNWQEALRGLKKAEELAPGEYLAWNAFFVAMTHWQHGEKGQARKDYEQAVQWMQKKQPNNQELRRFRSEAEELLSLNAK